MNQLYKKLRMKSFPVSLQAAKGNNFTTRNFQKVIKDTCRKALFALFLVIGSSCLSYATVTTLSTGSFIVNMGVTPQTVANGLKPYGMIYDLIKNYGVPIDWVINQNKAKDGTDFVYNSTAFKGGTFIIPAEYRTATVNSRITYWTGQGVVGITTTSTLTVDVTTTLKSAPRWSMDAQNGSIAIGFLVAAGIPSSAYAYQNPSTLNSCDDIYVMPHADPTWSTHSNLFFWNKTYRGAIWGGCHAVSVMEGPTCVNPGNSAQNLKFLSTIGLVNFANHTGGSLPYSYQNPTNPQFQMMGIEDQAHTNGSEQVYLPLPGSTWNSTVHIGCWDPTQANVPSASPGPAGITLMGRGFADSTRGYVMYQSGHNIGGTASYNVAAQREFFDFSFYSAMDKTPVVTYSGIPTQFTSGVTSATFSAGVTSNAGATSFTYQWVSTMPGTFSAPTAATTTFTPSSVNSATTGFIYCKVSDPCGRTTINPVSVTVEPAPKAPLAVNDAASVSNSCTQSPIVINVLANDTNYLGNPLTLNLIGSGSNGSFVNNNNGTVTYTPNINFNGTDQINYTLTDNVANLVSNQATITVTVGTLDIHGCSLNQIYGISYSASADSVYSGLTFGVTADTEATGSADGIVAAFNGISDSIVLRLGDIINNSDTLQVTWASHTAQTTSLNVYVSASATGPYTLVTGSPFTRTTTTLSTTFIPNTYGNIQFVKLKETTSNKLDVDAVEYDFYGCNSRIPSSSDASVTTLEDAPITVDMLSMASDPSGTTLSLTNIIAGPYNGKASVNINGTITYVNNTDTHNNDSLQVQICDTLGYCTTSWLKISVIADGCSAGNYKPYGSSSGSLTITNSDLSKINDSYLNQAHKTNNYGTTTTFLIGRKPNNVERAVLWFDVSAIPANAIVTSSTLNIKTTTAGSNKNITLGLGVFPLTHAFTENQVTWNISGTGNNWTTAGGDYSSTSVASTTITTANIASPPSVTAAFNISALTQNWVSNSSNNLGILIKQNKEATYDHALAFASSEASSLFPTLVVNYNVPAACTSTPNRAPLAQPDFGTTNSTKNDTINVLANDADVDAGNTITITGLVGSPSSGTAIVSGNNIIYTPVSSFNGTATLKYRIVDNNGAADTALVTITVTNSAPVANADSYSMYTNGGATTLNVESNDSDPEGQPLTPPTITLYPSHGTAVVSGNNIVYTPNANYSGQDTMIYQVCEASNGSCGQIALCDTGKIVIVGVVNRAPVTNLDTISTPACNPISIDVLANDIDPDGGTLTLSSVTSPLHGTATIVANKILYTPASAYVGLDTFTYQVCDNATQPLCTTGRVHVNVVNTAPVNHAPVTSTDNDSTYIGQTLYLDVLSLDSDPDNDPINVDTSRSGLVNPSKGTITVLSNNLIKYIPNTGASGNDSFQYRVCDSHPSNGSGCVSISNLCTVGTVKVKIINRPPIAIDDSIATTTTVTVSSTVASNDIEPDGQPMTFTLLTQPSAGSISMSSNGNYTLNPSGTSAGNYTATYQVCDNASPSLCDTGNIFIKISTGNLPPEPQPDLNTTLQSTPVSGNVATNDFDPNGNMNPNSFAVVSGPNNGSITLNSNGTYTYTPNTGFSGTDIISYQVCDFGTPSLCGTSTLTITVMPNNPPVANSDVNSTNGNTPVTGNVGTNDTDPDGNLNTSSFTTTCGACSTPANGTLVLNSNGSYTYTPNAGFTGTDHFVYQVCDNGTPSLCDTAIVTITVNNRPPVANPDAASTNGNTPVSASVTSNDSDPDGNLNSNSYTLVCGTCSNVSNGTLVFNSNGSYTYTPNSGFTGTDHFVYQVCDNGTPSLCDTAIVTITVNNQSPVANPDVNTTNGNTPVTGNVGTNDTDPDGNLNTSSFTTTCGACSIPANGTLVLNSNGSYTYTPNSGFTGTDHFVYQVCDNGTPSLCDTALVTITVTNRPPVANPDAASTNGNTPVSASVTGNDSDPDGNLNTNSYTLTCGTCSNVSNGSLVFNSNGSYTYTPNSGFTGTDHFVYQVCDNGTPSLCDTALVTITVTNRPPVANPDVNSTNGNTAVSGNVGTNDTDPDGNLNTSSFTTTCGACSTPANGTLVLNSNGAYTYTPNSGFTGTDHFVYQVCDNGTPSLCDTAIVTITVNNRPPVANPDAASTNGNTPVSASVTANDSDPDGNLNTNSYTLVCGTCSNVSNGTLVFNSNGSYTYTPNSGFTGTDHFVYQVCDNDTPSLCDTAIVTITVNNRPPVANPDAASTNGNTPVSASVTANDSDPDGNLNTNSYTLTCGTCSNVSNGTLVFNSNGSYTYTPNSGFTGTDHFVYQVCDNGTPSLCDTAIVTITVTNRPPVANPDATSTNGNTPVSASVTANDSDPDGNLNTNSYTLVCGTCSNVSNGTLVFNSNGSYTYTPNSGFTGTDYFVYQVCDNGTPSLCDTALVTITVTNRPPVANPDANSTVGNTAVSGNVGTNDSDPDGNLNSTSFTTVCGACTTPTNGTLTFNNNGTYTYTPNSGFTGTDHFIYQVCDNASPSLCDTAIVTITVGNRAPVANPDVNTTNGNTAVSGNVSTNDSDPDGNLNANSFTTTCGTCSTPANGTLVFNNNGTYTYTPNSGFTGTDHFVYQVCDNGTPSLCDTAIVTITVNNRPPVANPDVNSTVGNTAVSGNVSTNDSDPDGNLNSSSFTTSCGTCSTPANGTLVLNNNGTYTYTPNNGFTGTDQFIYQVCDNASPSLCDTALVTITVGNRPPVAHPDAASTNGNTPVSASVTANDSDPDGNLNTNSYTLVCGTCSNVSNGTLVFNSNGSYTYTPNSGFTGTDHFVYQVCDNGTPSLCDTAIVTITVTNRPPVANPDVASTNGNTPLTGNVGTNDTDPDGNLNTSSFTTTCGACSIPANGTLVLNPNGSYTYTPNSGFTGTDHFVYQVCDNGTPSLCDTAIVTITVNNQPPVANPDAASTNGNTPVSASVTGNDSDPDGNLNTNSYTLVCGTCSNVSNGTLVFNSNGSYTYTPNSGFTGTDHFVYQVCDNGTPSLCDTAIVTITVNNQPPVANPDAASTNANTPVTGNVGTNDTDPDGNLNTNSYTLTCSSCTTVFNGTLIFNGNGTYTYTPDLGFSGTDYFIYQVCDNGNPSLCDTAIVYINVNVTPTINIIAAPGNTICAGTPVTFTASTTHGGTSPSYQWKKNGVNVGTNSGTYVDNGLSNGDTITCTLTSNAPGAQPNIVTSNTLTITVNPMANQPATFTSSSAITYQGQTGVVYTVPNDPTVTYSWSYSGTGATIVGSGNSVTVNFNTHATSGNLCVTATTILGCGPSASRCMAITVKPYITWNCSTSNDWNTASNWDAGFAPYGTISVLIPAGTPCTPDICTGNTAVNNITINSGATVNICCGNELDVKGNFTNNGSVLGCGKVVMVDTCHTIYGNGRVDNFEVNTGCIVCNTVINAGDTLHIGKTYTPTSGTLITNGGLELLSDSTTTAVVLAHGNSCGNCNTYIIGDVICDKYIHGLRRAFRFFGHPFTNSIALNQLTQYIDITGQGGAANGFTTTFTNNPSAFWYNTLTGNGSSLDDSTGWIPFTNTDGLGQNAWNPYQGIRVLVRGQKGQGLGCTTCIPQPVTIKLHGPINECDEIVTTATNANVGYNFISNPYPSNIDLSTITRGSAIGSNFAVWDPNQGIYGAYITQPFSFTYVLPSMSAFFVTSSSAVSNNTITFHESDKTGASPSGNLFKTTSGFGNDVVQLHILSNSDSVSWDRLLLFFNGQANSAMDVLDADKIYNPGLSFYSYSSDAKQLSVDVRPFSNDVVRLGIQNADLQDYTIRVDDYDIPAASTLYLHDKYLNQIMPMFKGLHYNFTVTADPASQGDNRFEINMNTTGITNVGTDDNFYTSMIPNPATDNAELSFSAPLAGNTEIKITNLTGQVVYSNTLGLQQKGKIRIQLKDLVGGVYMVTIKCGNFTTTKRLIKQ